MLTKFMLKPKHKYMLLLISLILTSDISDTVFIVIAEENIMHVSCFLI